MFDRSALKAAALVALGAALAFGGLFRISPWWGFSAFAATLFAALVLIVHVLSRRIRSATERLESRMTLDQLQHGRIDWRLRTRYSATPDLIWIVVETAVQRQAKLCVELGSGVSTLVLARIFRALDLQCRLVSVEHDADYAKRVQESLRDEQLDAVAKVVVAPIEPIQTIGYRGPWYRTTGWVENVASIDILLVDGPPKKLHPDVRYAAVPALRDRLAPGAVIVLDDARRGPERRALRRWKKMFPGASAEYIDAGHGIGVIRTSSFSS